MPPKVKTKDLLIRIAKNDDKKAFSTFYNNYHTKLLYFAKRFLPTYQDAEDVVSEVMIKLLKQRKILCKVKNFEGYLYHAVKNQSLNYIKKHHKFYSLSFDVKGGYEASSDVQPIHKLLEGELRTCITQTVENLPPQRKLIYKMIKDDGLKCKEVADLLEISEKTVKKHLELAVKDLKSVIENYYYEKKSMKVVKKIVLKLILLFFI